MTKKGKKKESTEDGFHPKRAAVDTCVIINAMLRDNDKGLPGAWERSVKLLDDGIGGKLELLLPSMVVVELATNHSMRSKRPGVDPTVMDGVYARIVQWCKDAEFAMIDLTEDAVDWILDHPELREDLRPADAAILASARFAEASVVYSWDAKFAKIVEKANRIAPLGITVEEPPELPVPDPVEPDEILTLFPDEDGDGTE